MKVIEERFGEEWTTRVTCANGGRCGSLLEIDKDDIELSTIDYTDYIEYAYEYYITCPKCGATTILDTNDIPDWVQRYVRDKYQNHKK